MWHSRLRRRVPRVQRSIHRVWIAIMTAPLWAVLLSLVGPFVDPLKHALEHHMHPVNYGTIPLTLVVIGAYSHDLQIDGDSAIYPEGG